MKALAVLLSLLAYASPTQDSQVQVWRWYGNNDWRESYRTSICQGWLGIMFRDTTTGNLVALKVTWPVPANCTPTSRSE